MVKIIYAQGWRSKPFKYGRPFVRLEDYEKLKEKIKGDEIKNG